MELGGVMYANNGCDRAFSKDSYSKDAELRWWTVQLPKNLKNPLKVLVYEVTSESLLMQRLPYN